MSMWHQFLYEYLSYAELAHDSNWLLRNFLSCYRGLVKRQSSKLPPPTMVIVKMVSVSGRASPDAATKTAGWGKSCCAREPPQRLFILGFLCCWSSRVEFWDEKGKCTPGKVETLNYTLLKFLQSSTLKVLQLSSSLTWVYWHRAY